MLFIVPFAAFSSDAGRQALAGLELPGLRQLLRHMTVAERDAGDEWGLSPPHERALARALGWQGADGGLPWAARAAAADGVEVGDLPWGLLTPAHWHLGTDQVSLLDPAGLSLDDTTSRALFDAVSPLFTSEGYGLAWGAALRWYAAHESLADMPCASLDRVIGRNVDRWLGGSSAMRRLRRLQSEVQMQLHGHPINEEREARGLLPVNSFWLSGCGVAQAGRLAPGAPAQVDERLRAPALADDATAWLRAWNSLDEGLLAEVAAAVERGDEARLVLCGERSSVTLAPAARGLLAGLRRSLAPRPDPVALLESL